MATTPAPDAAGPRLIWRRVVADTETPVSAYLKLAKPGVPGCLLESVEGGSVRGRYSMLGLAPDLIWRATGARSEINRRAQHDLAAFEDAGPTLAALRALVAECQTPVPAELPGALSTLVGYFGYETVNLVERLPAPKADPLGVPDMLFMRPSLILVFDRLADELTLVAPVYPGAHTLEPAEVRLDEAERALNSALPKAARTPVAAKATLTPAVAPQDYSAWVDRAKDYIAAGDIFQVVLAQRFTQPFTLPPFDLYRALRRINPSPFLYYLDLPGFQLVGSSPEILVRARDGDVTIRPIAGTRPRGTTEAADDALRAELLADPKERAEHLMLLDLGRNDIGRVAVPGSIAVTESFTVERYSHVMHIVSNVRGRLDSRHDAIDALLAGFPAGTVSGAPKVRAMEIIHELEPEKRGPYAGGVGYFAPDGGMDSCIVLRTAIVKDGVMHVKAGAGIVADSLPEAEQRECEAKSGALFAAAAEALRIAGGNRSGQ